MMASTKQVDIEFGSKAYKMVESENVQSTHGYVIHNFQTIKMIQKRSDDSFFSGYRKVNFSEQKKQDAYRKINKMLGGN